MNNQACGLGSNFSTSVVGIRVVLATYAMVIRRTQICQLCGILLVFVACCKGDDGRRSLTAEDVLNVTWAVSPEVSPDGARVSYSVVETTDGGRQRTSWMCTTSGRGTPRRILSDFQDVSQLRWSPNGERIAFLATDEQSGTKQLFVANRDASKPQRVTKKPNGIVSFRWSRDSSMFAFTADERPRVESNIVLVGSEADRVALWTVGLSGSKPKRISADKHHVVDFAWSPGGERFAAMVANSEPVDGHVLPMSLVILDASDGSILQTLSEDATGGCNLSWSPDGKAIAAPVYSPRKLSRRLALFSPDGGEPRFPFEKFHATPIGRVEWSHDSRHLFVRFLHKTRNQLVRLDTKSGEHKHISDELINFWSFGIDRSGTTIALNAESQHDPPDIFVRRHAEFHRITDFNPDFEKKFLLGNVSTVQWQSSLDGRTVYGVLITPPSHQPDKPSPTIVNLHSGPHWWWWEGWIGTYMSWGQFLASHGYAVFLPNHRGSLGQGWEFAEAHFQEWGRGDYQDVIDGVDMLVEKGIADPKRLGIGGSSFGGYLTAFAITQTDRFKVAVVEAGWTDLVSSNLTTDAPEPLRRYMGGNVFERRDLFRSRSALSFADRCETPTLIWHGQHDRRVPIDQSWSFYRALKLHGVETKLVVYKDEGHGFAKRDNQLDAMRRMKAWFDRYLLSE